MGFLSFQWTPVWIMGFQCGCYVSSVKPWITVSILKCGYWDSSVDHEFPVWILVFQCRSGDSSVDTVITVNIGIPEWFVVVQSGSWDFCVVCSE